jgi:UDP-glucose 4-epimerase
VKILVTGHKGYIGSHLYSNLTRLGYDVHGIDLKDGKDILYCLPDEKFDYVFHLAAIPKVSFCVSNPSYTMRQNVLVTSVLLEWAKNHGVKRVIFSSSAAVYGNGEGFPSSPYGLHKLMSEMECKLFSQLYGLDTVCLRYFNVYSEDQPFEGSYSTAISAWMQMIREGKPLRIDGDGEQTRDFIHVDDIVLANIYAMQASQQFNGKSYDVGTGESVSLNYIKNFINSVKNVEWISNPERIGDVRHSVSDVSSFKDLGFEALVSIQKGLERCFKEPK